MLDQVGGVAKGGLEFISRGKHCFGAGPWKIQPGRGSKLLRFYYKFISVLSAEVFWATSGSFWSARREASGALLELRKHRKSKENRSGNACFLE